MLEVSQLLNVAKYVTVLESVQKSIDIDQVSLYITSNVGQCPT